MGLDLTDRLLQHKFKEERLPWFLAKSFPGSAVITQFESPELNVWSRDFWLTINDMEVQRGNMDQMVFDIPALIAYLSSRLPLTPGDLIYTGTPSGVGALESGDELILGLGEEIKGKFEVESALR